MPLSDSVLLSANPNLKTEVRKVVFKSRPHGRDFLRHREVDLLQNLSALQLDNVNMEEVDRSIHIRGA